MKRLVIFLLLICAMGIGIFLIQKDKGTKKNTIINKSQTAATNPLTITSMRQKLYLGSTLTFETTLPPGPNYNRYIVAYQSDGLKQYGLLTVPAGEKPSRGWPVILFNHGYIPPTQYSTENSYASFVDSFAASGYIVLKPDYRGNGNSQGVPVQIYASPDYLTDSMNALASIQQFKDANPQKIGVFGHSMGGNIALHELVISKDIKAASIMSGVVGDEINIVSWWDKRTAARSIIGNDLDASYLVQQMVARHGTPSSNPQYWNAIDPTKYIADSTVPVQIQVGTADTVVPPQFSLSLRDILQNAGKTVDYHEYNGADHNLSLDISTALARTVEFFNKNLR